jgi:hypothetical protein
MANPTDSALLQLCREVARIACLSTKDMGRKCEKYGISADGKKADMLDRLIVYLNSARARAPMMGVIGTETRASARSKSPIPGRFARSRSPAPRASGKPAAAACSEKDRSKKVKKDKESGGGKPKHAESSDSSDSNDSSDSDAPTCYACKVKGHDYRQCPNKELRRACKKKLKQRTRDGDDAHRGGGGGGVRGRREMEARQRASGAANGSNAGANGELLAALGALASKVDGLAAAHAKSAAYDEMRSSIRVELCGH